MNESIQVIKNVLPKRDSVLLLKSIFDLKPLWNERKERSAYLNAPFYTLGTPMYLDYGSPEYLDKCAHFNQVLSRMGFSTKAVLYAITDQNNEEDWEFVEHVSNPGFHIFPPHMVGQYFFGRMHRDVQWKNLENQEESSQFSFTYVLKLPFAGGGLYVGDRKEYYPYEENTLYVHSGQFLHAIAPTPGPVLPCDYRITLQGHGFIKDGVRYFYW